MDAQTPGAGRWVLVLLRNVLTTAAVWVVVGVPAAALLTVVGLLFLFAGRSRELLVVGAVLGVVHGLWLTIGGRLADAGATESNWTGALSGALLGLLGLPAVYAHVTSATDDRMMVLYVVAAVCGGMLAGVISVRAVAAYGPWGAPTRVRSAVTGCVLLLALTAADYWLYRASTFENLPPLPLSQNAVENIAPGDMQGSQWSGCYHYEGRDGLSKSPMPPETGLLVIRQMNGTITGGDFGPPELHGGVDRNGDFRLGGYLQPGSAAPGGARVLWEGQFRGDSAVFTKRTTVGGGGQQTMIFNHKLRGTAQRIPCPEWVVRHSDPVSSAERTLR